MCSDWISGDILSHVGGVADIQKVSASSATEIDVLRIDSLPRLIQGVGYLKHRTYPGNTYLRGQRSLYNGTIEPTLFRGNRDFSSLGRKINKLIEETSDWQCGHSDHNTTVCSEILAHARRSTRGLFKAGVPRYATEPLLQHYGIRTRWIDVVDNLWVALWFACHKFVRTKEHIHVVRRNISDGDDEYVYVITVAVPWGATERRPGFYSHDNGVHVIDLRKAVPSFYLRPHAQHGLLVKPRSSGSDLQFGALQIPLVQALEWLGSSVLLSPFGLYPPASVDTGYRNFLDYIKDIDVPRALGYVDVIGPGY